MVSDLEDAARLERRLLGFWRGECDNPDDVIPRKRGETAASAMYIAGLRQKGDYRKAADYFTEVTADRNLLVACIRDFPDSAQNMLNNGLGALLDTRRSEDLAYAREIVAFVEKALPRPSLSWLVYAFACVAARSGRVDQAIRTLERALKIQNRGHIVTDANQSMRSWARKDDDLASLHGNPRFLKLVA
jgi:hypothetical protein